MASKHTDRPSKSRFRDLRLITFTRDEWTCQDCGKAIPPKTDEERTGCAAPMADDGDWLELEHIVPRAFGGDWAESNLRAACTTCNRIKSSSLIRAGWQMRFDEAVRILTDGPASRKTAAKAIRVLTEAID